MYRQGAVDEHGLSCVQEDVPAQVVRRVSVADGPQTKTLCSVSLFALPLALLLHLRV